MHLEQLRQNYRQQIVAIAEKYKAENIRIFGSTANGKANETSDIDILVHFKPGASLLDEAGLDIELSKLLGRKVDIIGDDNIREELRPFILDEAVLL